MTSPPVSISALSAVSSMPVTEGAFQALIRTFGLLERVMQPYFAGFGVSASQWAVLRTLQRAEQENVLGLRLTDLSDRLFIRPPSVTGVIDRLVRAGLVARKTSTDDLRAKLVRLTPKGRDLLERALASHAKQMSRVLGGLNTEEQLQLRRLLLNLGQHLTGMISQNRDDASHVTASQV